MVAGSTVVVGAQIIVESEMPPEFTDMLSLSVTGPRNPSSYWILNENMGVYHILKCQ